MRILGIDPAGSTGYAVLDDGAYVSSGVRRFDYPSKAQQRKGRAKGMKWLQYWDWMEALLVEHRPDVVVAEDVKRHVSTLAGHSYGFVRYAIEALCARHGIGFAALGVSEWKKLATRSGSAKKVTVAEAMTAEYGVGSFESDDESDALGVAHAGQALHRAGGLSPAGRAVQPQVDRAEGQAAEDRLGANGDLPRRPGRHGRPDRGGPDRAE